MPWYDFYARTCMDFIQFKVCHAKGRVAFILKERKREMGKKTDEMVEKHKR